MAAAESAWPRKTRELHNHHMDSTVWNDFPFRNDDIVIGTYAKSGTTWTQQIVAQLILGGTDAVNVPEMSPWLDARLMPREAMLAGLEAQRHRRFIKTHLPVDALTFSPKAKYIYIGRDGRDVVWSLYNHHRNFKPEVYDLLNGPGLVGAPLEPPAGSIRRYFHEWLDGEGYPFWSFWENVRTWWEVRHLPNVLLIHFADLKADLPGQIRRIASFLDIEIDEKRWPMILERCSFGHMKANAEKVVPLAGALWEGGAKTFIHKGTNGRWRDMLTSEECLKYEDVALEQLGFDCSEWLELGSLDRLHLAA